MMKQVRLDEALYQLSLALDSFKEKVHQNNVKAALERGVRIHERLETVIKILTNTEVI